MAWTKQTTQTAKVSNDDVRIEFSAGSGKLFALVVIESDTPGPHGLSATTLQAAGTGHNAGLTAQERTDLIAILGKIRDAALPIAGFSGP